MKYCNFNLKRNKEVLVSTDTDNYINAILNHFEKNYKADYQVFPNPIKLMFRMNSDKINFIEYHNGYHRREMTIPKELMTDRTTKIILDIYIKNNKIIFFENETYIIITSRENGRFALTL